MEKNDINKREELKTYFETGKYPTQSQFAELIDALKLKEDIPNYKELTSLANSLEALDYRNIQYHLYDVGNQKFPIVISSQDAEDVVIKFDNTTGNLRKLRIFGKPPFIIKTKEFPAEGLVENEYYYFNVYADSTSMTRIFGNNLPTIPDGFELGTFSGEDFFFSVNKYVLDKKINIIKTNIKFINNTETDIQYKVQSNNWGNIYTNIDSVTDHYDIWDYLYFNYKVNLQNINRNIECKVYNADNNQLLMTTILLAQQNNLDIGGEGQANEIRNIRIECDYQIL